MIGDPKAAEEALGGGKALSLFEGSYREIIDLPSARAGYKQFFEQIATTEHQPSLFHCTTGKDRTGWAAAALLLLLGVSKEDVYADYLLTNVQLAPMTKPVSAQFASIGGDPAVLAPVLGVQKEYLDAAIDEMTSKYGTIDPATSPMASDSTTRRSPPCGRPTRRRASDGGRQRSVASLTRL